MDTGQPPQELIIQIISFRLPQGGGGSVMCGVVSVADSPVVDLQVGEAGVLSELLLLLL